MKLYNTLSRKVEEIKPQNPPDVTVYTCGPTVYDYPHIGNWFTFIRYDVLVRALKDADYKPVWTMNITDVGHLVSDADEGEDKLEKGAKREGKSAWQIADFYTDYFIKSLDRLNITRPDNLPRATEHIKEQINLISQLGKKNFTYKISDGIYFDTSKLSDYGKLARLDLEHLKAGARVEINPEKRNPADFALWKFSPEAQKRDMEWDSPWGKGFPGWHLECSAMAMKYLGETIDIHGGGIDHIPVHHTNEIAQSEAVTDKPFANHWFHSNFVLIDEQKMAKSANNFYTLEDIVKNGYDPLAFRLMVLQSHYRSQSNFTWEILKAAQTRLNGWQATVNLTLQLEEAEPDDTVDKLKEALSNDLDTPKVLALISGYFDSLLNTLGKAPNRSVVKFIENVLGIRFDHSDISAEAKQVLIQRAEARKKQDWANSDKLRDELKQMGIGVGDSPVGQIWFRL